MGYDNFDTSRAEDVLMGKLQRKRQIEKVGVSEQIVWWK
jgi:hypothetical protein